MIERTRKIYSVGTLPPIGMVPEKMHAWIFNRDRADDPSAAFEEKLVDVPLPGKGEVLVANICAGMNCRDISMEGRGHTEGECLCGSESSGIVYALGEGVTGLSVGDKVAVGTCKYDEGTDDAGDESPSLRYRKYEGNWGAFAQFSRVLEKQCEPIPSHMSWQDASAFIASGATAYRMLTHWKENSVKKGDVILIYGGTGGIGSMAIQLAAYFGALPVAVVSSEERGRTCMALGAAGYVDRTEFHHWGRLDGYMDIESQDRWMQEAIRFRQKIWEAAGVKKNPAIVIEHPGMDTMPTSLFVCASDGMVVTCGATTSYLTDVDLRFLWLSEKRIQGSSQATKADLDGYLEVIKRSSIRPYISHEFAWEELADAHRMLCGGDSGGGKMIVDIGIRRQDD